MVPSVLLGTRRDSGEAELPDLDSNIRAWVTSSKQNLSFHSGSQVREGDEGRNA